MAQRGFVFGRRGIKRSNRWTGIRATAAKRLPNRLQLAKGSQFGDQLQGNLINPWPKKRPACEQSFMTTPTQLNFTMGSGDNGAVSNVKAITFKLSDLPNYIAIQQAWQRYRCKKMEVLITNVKFSNTGLGQHLFCAGFKENSLETIPSYVSTLMGCAYKQIDSETVQLRKAIRPVYGGLVEDKLKGTSVPGLMQTGYVATDDPNVEWNSFVVQLALTGKVTAGLTATCDYVVCATLQLDRPKYQPTIAPTTSIVPNLGICHGPLKAEEPDLLNDGKDLFAEHKIKICDMLHDALA